MLITCKVIFYSKYFISEPVLFLSSYPFHHFRKHLYSNCLLHDVQDFFFSIFVCLKIIGNSHVCQHFISRGAACTLTKGKYEATENRHVSVEIIFGQQRKVVFKILCLLGTHKWTRGNLNNFLRKVF